ncbi:hypothetical protein GJ496_004073 [Pomphorhynchus laevis]|nr:hypothetical protein GJ496_004073 [Pomphorhynchus laevis]
MLVALTNYMVTKLPKEVVAIAHYVFDAKAPRTLRSLLFCEQIDDRDLKPPAMMRFCASAFSSCCLTDSKAWLSGIVDRLIRLPQSQVQQIQSVGLSGVFDLPVWLLKSIVLSIRCVRLFDTVDRFVRLAKSVIKSIQVSRLSASGTVTDRSSNASSTSMRSLAWALLVACKSSSGMMYTLR